MLSQVKLEKSFVHQFQNQQFLFDQQLDGL